MRRALNCGIPRKTAPVAQQTEGDHMSCRITAEDPMEGEDTVVVDEPITVEDVEQDMRNFLTAYRDLHRVVQHLSSNTKTLTSQSIQVLLVKLSRSMESLRVSVESTTGSVERFGLSRSSSEV